MSRKYSYQDIKEVINDVRICSMQKKTKNSKIYSLKAEEFIDWMSEYSKYCALDMQEKWNNCVRELTYNILIPKNAYVTNDKVKEILKYSDYSWIDKIYNFVDAGDVMKVYSETNSLEEVYKVLKEQGHSGYTFSGMSIVVMAFSTFGVEFIDRFDATRPKRDEKFAKMYNQAKISKDEKIKKKTFYNDIF